MIDGKKVAVVMIVKNEASVITRALTSVASFVDHIVISDTGSEDDTLEVIKAWRNTHAIPVSVSSTNWLGFAANRNIAFAEARYCIPDVDDWLVLSLDADDQFVLDTAFVEGTSAADMAKSLHITDSESANSISLKFKLQELVYSRVAMVRAVHFWRWHGVVHEYLYCESLIKVPGTLTGGHIKASSEGARSANPNKYLDDARALRLALEEDRLDTRSVFYLARSYHDHYKMTLDRKYLDHAIEEYLTRTTMVSPEDDPFEEERWYSRYMWASLTGNLPEMLEVCSKRPWRAETALEVSRLAETKGLIGMAYAYALTAAHATKPHPKDILFVDTTAYGWRSLDRLGVIAYYAGMFQVGLAALDECLGTLNRGIPESDLERMDSNRKLYLAALKQ